MSAGTAVALQQQQTLKMILTTASASLAKVAPKHLSAERMVRIALLAAVKMPKLYECDPKTVLQSVMDAAALGLEPGGLLGHGYLVPYYNNKRKALECQFQPGYRGLALLAVRGGVKSVQAFAVFEGDEFRVEYGSEPRIVHRPKRGTGERVAEQLTDVYSIAQLDAEGTVTFDHMERADVERIRARSKQKDSGPWVTDYVEMAKKTVVKRHCKSLPLTPDSALARALEIDNRAESGEVSGVSVDLDTEGSLARHVAEKTAEATESLREKLAGAKQRAQQATAKAAGSGDADEDAEMRRQDAMDRADAEAQTHREG